MKGDWLKAVTQEQLLIVALVSLFLLFFWLLRQRFHLRREIQLRGRIEAEEKRLFDFIRGLGHAIEGDISTGRLNRVIVKGVVEVLGSSGSALYLLDERNETLQPAYLSKGMPSLTGLPKDVLEKSGQDRRMIHSYLRLTQLEARKGLFGKTLTLGEPILVDDAFADLSMAGEESGNTGKVAAMLAPLHHGSAVLGLLATANHDDLGGFSANDFEVFRSLSEQAAFALGNAMAHQEAAEKRIIDRELRAASEVQRILLPDRAPEFAGFRLAGRNLPARVISGDYLDYVHLADGRLAAVVGDVSGKGVPAGLLMTACRAVLRTLAPHYSDPAALLCELNRQLFPDINEDMFISLVMVVLEPDSSKISLARAGHDPPLIYRRESDEVQQLKPRGLAIGIDEGPVFERVTDNLEIDLEPGDCLLLYTDGIPEAVDANGFDFGREELVDTFREGAVDGHLAAIDLIESRVREFVAEQAQSDDLTLMVIERWVQNPG